MTMNYFAEMHKLVERAKTYEKVGKDSDALALYLEVHEKFFPNTSDLYERPAVLLEKKKRFDEAIAICEKAIKYIEEGKVTGVKENFQRRIDRIKARSDYEGQYKTPEKKQAKPIQKKASEPMDWSFLKNVKVRLALISGTLVSILIIGAVIWAGLFLTPSLELKMLDFDFSILQKEGLLETPEENKAYEEAALEALEKEDKIPDPKPAINEGMIERAVTVAEKQFQVVTAGVLVKSDVAGFALIVNPQMSNKDAEKAADTFIKALAAEAASEYAYLDGPSLTSYGELYKHYSIMVAIGTEGVDGELFLIGTKKKAVENVFYRAPLKEIGL